MLAQQADCQIMLLQGTRASMLKRREDKAQHLETALNMATQLTLTSSCLRDQLSTLSKDLESLFGTAYAHLQLYQWMHNLSPFQT